MTKLPDARPFLRMLTRAKSYQRPSPVVLVNGLAEQGESWFATRPELSRRYDVMVPELLTYAGASLHRHIESGGEVTVEYLAGRLASYLHDFAPEPPYHLVGSSLGGQVALTYAANFPEKVGRIVLIAPSGIHGAEHLPLMDGVRRGNYESLVGSVFRHPRFASGELVDAMARKFADRRWKTGVLRTLRGTMGHSVANLLDGVTCPCLFIWGADDRVIADVPGAIRAASRIPGARQVVIPNCGHAPQIEKARLVNTLIDRFLRDRLKAIPSPLRSDRFLRERENLR